MIAETMAGIALVKASVDGIKKAITTCNDIGDIAKYIDGMFEGEQQIQKKRTKASKDPFSVNSIAEETINAKLAQEHMQEMKNLINMRFGPGIWEGIIAERAKRIQQAKEAEKQARIVRRKKHEALVHNLEITTIIVVCSCIAVAALIGLILLV